jgi:hypothetical protein
MTGKPLEVLADFAVLSEMILEVAKWKYREENASRHRVPRGFSEDISLKLTGVEEGSAIPVIALVVSSALLLPPESEHYFYEARDSIISAVAAAEHGSRITDHLPERLLGYFDRFGRSDRIEFRHNATERATYERKPSKIGAGFFR